MQELTHEFMSAVTGTLRYGFFAPVTAARLAVTRPGGYVWHFRALYRLAFGRSRL